MKKIRSKLKALESGLKIYVDFSGAQRSDSDVSSRIWQKFELIQVFMHVLVIYKNEIDPIKMNSLKWP